MFIKNYPEIYVQLQKTLNEIIKHISISISISNSNNNTNTIKYISYRGKNDRLITDFYPEKGYIR
jgi:nucleoid-associated protein YejK